MVSVIIPAYNEADDLPKCLDSLTKQLTRHQFEVVVVDNASTDQTKAAAITYKAKLKLKVIEEARTGRGAARAAGFAASEGRILLSTDADTILPPNWVDSLVDTLDSHPDWVALSGTCRIIDQSLLVNGFFNWFQPFSMRVFRLLFGHYWLTGSNFAIRSDIYKRSGGFNPKIPDLEDHDLAFKVRKLGRIGFLRRPAVITSGERYHQGLFRGLGEYVRAFNSRFLFKRKRPYSRD